jgi:hypothetical protein
VSVGLSSARGQVELDEINKAYADKAAGELICGVIDFDVTGS